jgi:hypothetical protein
VCVSLGGSVTSLADLPEFHTKKPSPLSAGEPLDFLDAAKSESLVDLDRLLVERRHEQLNSTSGLGQLVVDLNIIAIDVVGG